LSFWRLFCGAAGALHQQQVLKPQDNVKRDASRRARLAVWCSSLTRGTQAGTVGKLISAGLVPIIRLLAQVTKAA